MPLGVTTPTFQAAKNVFLQIQWWIFKFSDPTLKQSVVYLFEEFWMGSRGGSCLLSGWWLQFQGSTSVFGTLRLALSSCSCTGRNTRFCPCPYGHNSVPAHLVSLRADPKLLGCKGYSRIGPPNPQGPTERLFFLT